MNFAKMTFTPLLSIENKENAVDSLWEYLGCLYKNGQILKSYELVTHGSDYIAFMTLPEDDSIDEKYNNLYVTKYLGEVKEHYEVHLDMIGKNLNEENACTCPEPPEWYMLYADYADEESPVVCGRCGHSVPLYKLPHILEQQEHYGVLGWKEAYCHTDNLYMYCLSDRFTYRQMNSPDSRLSKIGRDICQQFEAATGLPFYYYLFYDKNTPKLCPLCGGEWKLNGEKTFVDYKCDKCRLVADEV